MNITVEMPWERDLSVNQMRFGAGGGYRKKPHVQAWMERLAWQANTESIQYDSYIDDDGNIEDVLLELGAIVSVVVDLRYPDKRRRDDHNYYKVICDAVAAGLGIDDKDIRIRTGSVVVDRDNPGFTITVTDEDE